MWVTYQDIQDAWVGGLIPAQQATVETLISYAEEQVLDAYPLIQGRIDAGTLRIEKIKLVVITAVSRFLRNPAGLTYLQENTGPFGHGLSFGKDQGFWLTDAEISFLAPTKGNKAYQINMLGNDTNPVDTEVVWNDVY